MDFKGKLHHLIKLTGNSMMWRLLWMVMETDHSKVEIQAVGTSSQASFPPWCRYTIYKAIYYIRAPTQSELMRKQNVSLNALPHTGTRIKEAILFDWFKRRECGTESKGICKWADNHLCREDVFSLIEKNYSWDFLNCVQLSVKIAQLSLSFSIRHCKI